MSAPFASRLCDSSGLPEPAESQSQDCGSKNPTATCMRGQCCNAEGQCGPITNRDGQFILNGVPTSRSNATDFFCRRNQGDWRNWAPAGSCGSIPVKYPRDISSLVSDPPVSPDGPASAGSGLSPTQWAIVIVSVLAGLAIIGEGVNRTRVYLAGKKRDASEPAASQRRASSVDGHSRRSRPSFAGSEYVYETVHESVPVRPRNSSSASPFVNGRLSYSESPAVTPRSSAHRLSFVYDDGISIRSGTPATGGGGSVSAGPPASPLYQYDPATIFLPAPPASTGPNPFPKYARLLHNNPGLEMGSRTAAFPYLPSTTHDGHSGGELLVCAKQLVSVESLTPDGYARGTLVDTGARGTFPAWILRPNGEADVLIRALTEEYVQVMERAAKQEYAAYVQAAQGYGDGGGGGDHVGPVREYVLPEASEVGVPQLMGIDTGEGQVEVEVEVEQEEGVVLIPFARSSFDASR